MNPRRLGLVPKSCASIASAKNKKAFTSRSHSFPLPAQWIDPT
jgi:hypothetical protein